MNIRSWKIKAAQLKIEINALYLCSKHPQVPWYAKLFAFLIIGYALSPIDLIPDFIPIIGYFDDLILIPLGIMLLIKMIPAEILAECRKQARSNNIPASNHRLAAFTIILIWVSVIYLFIKIIGLV